MNDIRILKWLLEDFQDMVGNLSDEALGEAKRECLEEDLTDLDYSRSFADIVLKGVESESSKRVEEENPFIDKELEKELKSMEEFRKKVSASPEASLAFLVKAGICTESGELTEQYGGPRDEEDN